MWLPKIPYYRFIVMMVAFFCLMSIFSNYTIMNFAFICMKDDMHGAIPDANGGIAYAADFAVIGIICVKWAPLDEVAFFISLLTVFSPFATVITTAITGYLCTSSLGWRASFYVHSVAGAVCFLLWVIVYSDDPLTHQSVTQKESDNIQKGKTASHFSKKRDIPYLKMMTNPALICTWFNAFMDLSMSIMIITYSPIYLNSVLEYPIDQTALVISITNFAQLPFKFTAAYISDRLTIINPKTKMLIFNTIACGIVSLLFGGFGFVSNDQRWIAMVLLAAVNCLMSTSCGGFYQCGRYVSQQFADVVIAAIQFCKCLALFFVPAIVALTVSNEDDRTEWTHSFLIMSALLMVANISAYFFFTDQPAEFTKEQETSVQLKESIKL
uniref:MFS domain-containing protein n=2 Tax=Caenorhabditis japonica TaxID=281687 RepID=A0A8R1DKU6_CAEJA